MRSSTIDLLLNPIYEYLDKLLATAESCVFEVKSASDDGSSDGINASENARELCRRLRRDCLYLQIGSLVCSLTTLGLWPRKDTSQITMSSRNLSEALLKIDVSDCIKNGLPKTRKSAGSLRTTCGSFPNVIRKIQGVLDNKDGGIANKLERRMAEQRRKWDSGWTPT